MRMGREAKRQRAAAFRAFVKAVPVAHGLGESFTHLEYKRVLRYVGIAFATGYGTGANDFKAGKI
jgi:hypothetical protein